MSLQHLEVFWLTTYISDLNMLLDMLKLNEIKL